VEEVEGEVIRAQAYICDSCKGDGVKIILAEPGFESITISEIFPCPTCKGQKVRWLPASRPQAVQESVEFLKACRQDDYCPEVAEDIAKALEAEFPEATQ
jgi:hypothetical protein